MCRSIKTLFHFEPPASEEEIRAAALQFVRKLSGFQSPSKSNHEVFFQAVDDITTVSQKLLATLVTNGPPKDRETEAAKAKARNEERFGKKPKE